ncbi:uncharacterized protein LOC120486641 [Pimephales promelas]|uniref:uncharacterized protein LOC120486641 n=1 Tax=Pimephales promelas TaxID=90988 RepID=UPI001955C3A9|nr:uncharacterized protein LOC120486641 [Pimephales promelas]
MVHEVVVLLYLWHLVGVFAGPDAVESVSVTEGDSVSLNSGLTEMMDEDVILWRFGDENTLIAHINVLADSMTVYDDDLDGRFRDRLKLDDQTGSLIITHTTTEHTGVYTLQINGVRKSFNLTVYVPLPVSVIRSNSSSSSSSSSTGLTKCENLNITEVCKAHAEVHICGCDSVEAVLRLVVTALMGVASVAAVVLLVNDVRLTRG